MKLQTLIVIVSILSTALTSFAAVYGTHATAILNDAMVPDAPSKGEVSPLKKAQAMYQQLRSNALFFNNQDEIQAFLQFVKKHQLEKQMSAQIRLEIPRIQESFGLFGQFQYFKDVFYGKQQGLLKPDEFNRLMTELQGQRALRAKRFPGVNAEDAKFLQKAQDEYPASRAQHVQAAKAICGDDRDWTAKLPPRHSQSNTPWCYAFGLADLIAFEAGEPVSALDLVMLYRTAEMEKLKRDYNRDAPLYGRKLLQENEHIQFDYNTLGGSITAAFEQVQKRGYCPEKKLASEAKRIDGEVVALKDVTAWIQSLGRDLQAGALTVQNVEEKLKALNYQNFFVGADFSSAVSGLQSHNDLFVNLAESSCKDSRKTISANFNYAFERVDRRTWSKSFARLNQDLDVAPVAMSVSDIFLYRKSQWGRSEAANHLVLVTGRRWNEASEQCEFRIRNSQTLRLETQETEWYSDLDVLKNSNGIYVRQSRTDK